MKTKNCGCFYTTQKTLGSPGQVVRRPGVFESPSCFCKKGWFTGVAGSGISLSRVLRAPQNGLTSFINRQDKVCFEYFKSTMKFPKNYRGCCTLVPRSSRSSRAKKRSSQGGVSQVAIFIFYFRFPERFRCWSFMSVFPILTSSAEIGESGGTKFWTF